jgi:CHAT domain-containing protein/tetratricopeptide (TPR) repeat protein
VRLLSGLSAILGTTLVAFSLCGSTWRPAKYNDSTSRAEGALFDEGFRLYRTGEYTRASEVFRSVARLAEHDGLPYQAATNWNNAGGAALARLDFRNALPDFLKARQTAEAAGLHRPFLIAMNNLAALYLQMGDPDATLRVAKEGLADEGGNTPGDASASLRFQMATALARLNRFDEAAPIYRRAIRQIAEQDDFVVTARVLGNFGSACLDAGHLDEAEDALSEALFLVRLHRLGASANILRALAKLKKRRGDPRSAAALFDAAVHAPPGITPQWEIYADRGDFRRSMNDLHGALADFREGRRIAARMRADIVPADQDRIALEGGLSRLDAGLVDVGNLLARQTSDARLPRETFEAAELDRLWSLRALVPAPNDWRTRLPNAYWDLLTRYQSIQRSQVAKASPEGEKQASALQMELQQIEAAAANGSHSVLTDTARTVGESALSHARRVLDADSVLLSFYVTKSAGWLWAVDRHGVEVYSIPAFDTLKAAVAEFADAAKNGDVRAPALGRGVYNLLFGNVSARYLAHKRWLLELDGPLFDLPFASLVVNQVRAGKNEPIYLFESKVLQAIPGVLMLEARMGASRSGSFLGIGDPIYSPADTRYQGDRTKHEVVLPRLPATAGEIKACARAWKPMTTQLLTGANADLTAVRAALRSNPSVIHFATHVLTAPGAYSSGLIALSLDQSGAMGFIGPAEIAAYTLSPALVVLNGCHSGQGEALPGAGLMGLTRAWIGAGARSVLATRWDIPDEAGARMMVEFYRAFRANPERGPAFALQQAQLRFLKNRASGSTPAVWGAYFVLGRE